jgi:hypothetical protein
MSPHSELSCQLSFQFLAQIFKPAAASWNRRTAGRRNDRQRPPRVMGSNPVVAAKNLKIYLRTWFHTFYDEKKI